MEKKRILLTGFEPFSGLDINESSEVVKLILNSGLQDIEIIPSILSVDEEGTESSLDILDTIIRTILNETELPFIPALAVLRDWEHVIRTQLAKATSPGHLFSPLKLPDNF